MLLPPSNKKALQSQLNIDELTLAVLLLSSNASLDTKFLRGYPKSCLPLGALEQILSMNLVEDKWYNWCTEQKIELVSCEMNFLLEFVTDLCCQNYQHRTVSTFRGAISASYLPVDGSPIGSTYWQSSTYFIFHERYV